ncbi:MAG: 2-oxo-hept-4-ene-1,7-dioate hydratase [Xanthobacteraceae bacterium]
MALPPEVIAKLAEELNEAEQTRRQIRQISVRYPGITLDDAYAIQAAWVARKLASGRTILGHKIGLTSKAMQSALGIDEPDSGALFDDMFFPNSGVIPKNRFIGTRIEAELAFVLKAPVSGPGCTIEKVLQATDYVVPALEILDTRIERVDAQTGSTRKIFDTVADNAANAGIVVSERRIRPDETDLRWIGVICYRDDSLEETGLAAGVLDHPAMGIAWLANRMSQRGQRLEAGQVVLAGSFIRPIEAPSGVTIRADFGSFGTVSCRFE